MGGKLAIKVFKTSDLKNSIHYTIEPQKNTEPSSDKIKAERRSRRELISTISNWISERREVSRVEETEGLRRIFGDSISTLNAIEATNS